MRCCDCEFRHLCDETETILTAFVSCEKRTRLLAEQSRKQTNADRLALIEDILGDDYDLDRLRELVEADLDDRCVILKHTTVSDLRQQFTTLSSVCYGDDTETYTTGYRNGHRNGRVELLQYILGISDGVREAAEVALKAREQNE